MFSTRRSVCRGRRAALCSSLISARHFPDDEFQAAWVRHFWVIAGGTLGCRPSFHGSLAREDASMGAILLWLLGIPIPIIILLLLLWH